MNIEEIENLFNKLADNRYQMKNFYQINLKPLQLDFIKTKEELDSYNPEVIKRLERWLTEFNIKESSPEKDEEIAGLNMENIDSANTIYSSYIKTEEKFIALEQQINKYSKQYKTYKEEDTRLKEELLAKTSYLITDITREYYSNIDYNREEVIEKGQKALEEAFDTYKPTIPFTLMEYTEKIIKIHLKNYFKNVYHYKTHQQDELPITEYEYLLRKLISLLKTRQSIYKIYQLLKLNNHYHKDETINKVIDDLKNIISIFSDNDFENNIRLVKNIYEISQNLAEFIWSNKKSIAQSLTSFYNNNVI